MGQFLFHCCSSVVRSVLSPCSQAAQSKKPIGVRVALLDGRSVNLHLDSASTSAEVCQVLADKINLRDTYGFSLYISLFDKVALKFNRFCFSSC